MDLSLCPKTQESPDVFSILSHDHSIYLSSDIHEYITLKQQRKSAVIIQRTWRNYSSKKVYNYVKNKLYYFSQQDPVRLLKWKNPVEASIFDKKLGYHLVFRLDGLTFPPVIVYKIFISVGVHTTTNNQKSKGKSGKNISKTGWKSFYVYKSQRQSLLVTKRKRKFTAKSRKVRKNHGIKWITDMYSWKLITF